MLGIELGDTEDIPLDVTISTLLINDNLMVGLRFYNNLRKNKLIK
jgi:hypothetical protein